MLTALLHLRLRASRRRVLLAIAVLGASLTSGAVLSAGAPAADLQAKLAHKQAALSQVNHKRASLATSIAEANRQVDALLGQVSAVRVREAAVRQQLATKQAELDKAKAALDREHKRLVAVRARLKRAIGVLKRELVAIYEGNNPDVLSVILESANWSDVVAQGQYLNSINDYTQVVVERVKELRDQTRTALAHMRDARNRLQKARDAIAAQEHQIAAVRASLEARQADLTAARAARQQQLASLEGQAQSLHDNLASITNQIAAQAPQSPAASAQTQPAPLSPGSQAKLLPNGDATAPANAPAAVKSAIAAANQIDTTPYVWGGGHGSFTSSGYDCSGSVSYALHGGGLLDSPLDSTGLETWGVAGAGHWISVYANSGHVWAVIAGLRWDTVGGPGPRWHSDIVSTGGYIARHPSGL